MGGNDEDPEDGNEEREGRNDEEEGGNAKERRVQSKAEQGIQQRGEGVGYHDGEADPLRGCSPTQHEEDGCYPNPTQRGRGGVHNQEEEDGVCGLTEHDEDSDHKAQGRRMGYNDTCSTQRWCVGSNEST